MPQLAFGVDPRSGRTSPGCRRVSADNARVTHRKSDGTGSDEAVRAPDAGGLELARAYWRDVVGPILDRYCSDAPRAVARVGTGSDVLGLDDLMSRDHDWGLRLQVFAEASYVDRVVAVLQERLPQRFAGLPTRFTPAGQDTPRVGVDVFTVTGFALDRLGFDPRQSPSPRDWLSVSGQAALEVTGGAVFEDHAGALTELREAIGWYPEDLWRYVIACDWQRLDQELPLMGRAGDRGDDIGSRIIAARLVDIMLHLAFALSRSWAPYSKWRGTLFAQLPHPGPVHDNLRAALTAHDWVARSEALGEALHHLAGSQGLAGLPSVDRPCVPFWDRPYWHIDQALVPAILDTITDDAIRDLPIGLGAIDQRTDNVDLLVDAARRRAAVGA